MGKFGVKKLETSRCVWCKLQSNHELLGITHACDRQTDGQRDSLTVLPHFATFYG